MPIVANPNDVVYTPLNTARQIVEHFAPKGKCLDPCKGGGAFLQFLPSDSDWCEIAEGRDFFDYDKQVDWIISNPPYSIFDEWLAHSFQIAKNIVYAIPITKAFTSTERIKMIKRNGGIKEILVIGNGRHIGLPLGFACGAVHFQRDYRGDTRIEIAT